MASPARLHKQREEARLAAERAAERQETLQGSEHELALAQLAAHKRQLSAIQSMQARQAKKAELDARVARLDIDGVFGRRCRSARPCHQSDDALGV